MRELKITLPMSEETARTLRAGDRVLLSGVIYTARDEAHLRLCRMLDRGEALPIELKDAAIYYAGPCPAPPGRVIGPVGPTTAGRMDAWTPRLISLGLRCMIGKGGRNESVKAALREYGAVYLAATGGAGTLLAQRVKSAELIAFPDLGAEAIYRLVVEDFPCTVINDCAGGDLYKEGRGLYAVRLEA